MVVGKSSLRRRLPLWIALILAITVTTFGTLAWQSARGATVQATWVRLRGAAGQFAQLSATGINARSESLAVVARDGRLVAALQGGSAEAAREALLRLGPDTGLTYAVALLGADGRMVATLDRGLPEQPSAWPSLDGPLVGPLFTIGDTVAFNIAAPVIAGGRMLGHVVTTRIVRSNPSAVETLSQLVRPNARLLIGNRDGTVWSDLIRRVDARPAGNGDFEYERDGERWMLNSTAVQGTPFSIAIELPAADAVAPVRALPWTFGLLAAAVVLAGAFAGWLVTRRITDPLVQLTAAAESLAAGEPGQLRPGSQRTDEVGRLDRAFAQMSDSVRLARERLERQVAERTRELEQAQTELIQRERLAVLGELASSVGHELRNPLGVMSNSVYFLGATLRDGTPKTNEHLDILRRQIDLAEKIVTDILDFTKVKAPDTSDIDLREFVDEQLRRISLPPVVRVRRDVPINLPQVRADPVQIGQVLFNLFTNAVQAMEPAGGTLSVSSRPNNGMVRIEVADEGPGIPPESRTRIFEPLFTTKLRGIGLGLSVSRSLALANGGNLSVGEGNGKGAVFYLDLPAVPS